MAMYTSKLTAKDDRMANERGKARKQGARIDEGWPRQKMRMVLDGKGKRSGPRPELSSAFLGGTSFETAQI